MTVDLTTAGLTLAAPLVSPAASAGFIHLVAQTSDGTTGDTMTASVINAASTGNTVIAVVKGSLGASTSKVTDSTGSNTWTIDATGTESDGPSVAIVRTVLAADLTTSDTITVTFSNSSTYNMAIIAAEYDGAWTTPDVTYVTDVASGTSGKVTTSSETAYANELVVEGIGLGGTAQQTFTVSAGTPTPTLRGQAPTSPGIDNAALADTVTQSAGVSPTITWEWSSTTGGPAAIVTYVPSGSTGSVDLTTATLTLAAPLVSPRVSSQATLTTPGLTLTAPAPGPAVTPGAVALTTPGLLLTAPALTVTLQAQQGTAAVVNTLTATAAITNTLAATATISNTL